MEFLAESGEEGIDFVVPLGGLGDDEESGEVTDGADAAAGVAPGSGVDGFLDDPDEFVGNFGLGGGADRRGAADGSGGGGAGGFGAASEGGEGVEEARPEGRRAGR